MSGSFPTHFLALKEKRKLRKKMCVYMRKIFCVCLLILCLIIPASAITITTSDYDNNIWNTEQVQFENPAEIPSDWFPLRKLTEYIPTLEVEWLSEEKQIQLYNADSYWPFVSYYDIYHLPNGMKILNGVTYCSPNFLMTQLGSRGFVYNNEIYCYVGENVVSQKIICDKDEFRHKIISVLYQISVISPDTYDLIREYMTGGVEVITKADIPSYLSQGVVGFIRPGEFNPVCKLVHCSYNLQRGNLASTLTHEAYHVYQWKNEGDRGEEIPTQRGHEIRELLLETNKLKEE